MDKQKLFKILCVIFDDCVMILCLLFLLIGGYTCYDNYSLFYHAQDKSLLKFKPELLSDGTVSMEQGELTDDVVGWLTIDDTSVDYPIMQGEENTDYLNIDPYGNYSLSGSIFMDSRNSGDCSDPFTLLYGHHMENGYMFGALDDFMDEAYFNAHRTGSLIVTNNGESGRYYKLNIFAVSKTDSRNHLFEPTTYTIDYPFVQEISNIYITPMDTNNRILGMSTCQSAETTGRLVLFAEIIDTGTVRDVDKEEAVVEEETENKEVAPLSKPADKCYVHWILAAITAVFIIATLLLKESVLRYVGIGLYAGVAVYFVFVIRGCFLELVVSIIGIAILALICFGKRRKEDDRNQ